MEDKYFNETAFTELIRRITTGIDPESVEDQEALESILPSFHAYVDAVVRGETALLLSGRPEGQAYRDLVTRYDEARHAAHETAITNVRVLNRLADLYELSPVFTGDINQRHQVAGFCLELDRYLFVNRRMKLS